MSFRYFVSVTLVLFLFGGVAPAAAQSVTLESLLDEMIDREAMTRFPYPPYETAQASSYDRESTSPDDSESWFANRDADQFERVEERDGRTEFVMLDVSGPGAVVRIWSANPAGTLRIYLDNADEPALEQSMQDLLSGKGVFEGPLSAVRSRGWNLYVPIPFSERCVITSDERGFYYQINYRRYSDLVDVESFTLETLEANRGRLAEVQRTLLDPPRPEGEEIGLNFTLETRELVTLWEGAGPQAISEFRVRLHADDLAVALRTMIITMEFDREYTVRAPLSDFMAAGPGLVAYDSWWITVDDDGWMTCRWLMPFQNLATIRARNLAEEEVRLEGSIRVRPYEWDTQSMHFYTVWKTQPNIPTRPMRDWNFVTIAGRGVFAGDALTVSNPVEQWWGEGDEKIYVDHESFPSHFGTGTEDYYGYAWCCPDPFEAPFHNQVRCDGPGNFGITSLNRFRTLDAIPFTTGLKFDMEVWHWAETQVTYAATTYWYARPFARIPQWSRFSPNMLRQLPDPPPLPPPFQIDGAVEGEALEIVGVTDGLVTGRQDLWKKQTFSGDAHLWLQARSTGDYVKLKLPVDAPGEHRVSIYLTKSWDYGVIQPYINGEAAGEPIDTFNTEGREIASTGAIELGVFDLEPGATLRLEVIGTNAASEPPHYFFGLDAVRVVPAG
ncbi:MAG: glycoside hydrolase family 172 protein [Phycisphaerales bacterium]